MIKRGAIGLLAAVVLCAGLAVYDYWGMKAAIGALRVAGYGDMTLGHASASPCRVGEAPSAFLAQGLGKPEATGYVCASPFHPATIHVTPLSKADRLDWH